MNTNSIEFTKRVLQSISNRAKSAFLITGGGTIALAIIYANFVKADVVAVAFMALYLSSFVFMGILVIRGARGEYRMFKQAKQHSNDRLN